MQQIAREIRTGINPNRRVMVVQGLSPATMRYPRSLADPWVFR
jgi:hypothetical protein